MISEHLGAVLITGCSSGIGRALAAEFIKRRTFPVVATARNVESVKDLEGPNCRAIALDVTDHASVERAVQTTLEAYDAIHMLINNAGWGLMGPVAELDLRKLEAQLLTNVVGPVAMIKAVTPHMADRRGGVIVNVGSVSGVTASPFAGAYCASKSALHSLTDSLRMELRPFGISVVCLQPGAVLSSFGSTAGKSTGRATDSDSIYAPFEEAIQNRAEVSQIGGMPAEEFASKVVDDLLRDPAPAVIRHAPLSRKLPLLGRLPIVLKDRILAKKFGLV